MRIKKSINKVVLQILIFSVGIIFVTIFMYQYIHHVFQQDIENKLVEAAKYNAEINWKFDYSATNRSEYLDTTTLLSLEDSDTDEKHFQGSYYYAIVDEKGLFVTIPTASEDTSEYTNYINLSFGKESNKTTWEKSMKVLKSKENTTDIFYLDNGEPIYVGLVPLKEDVGVFSISLAPQSAIDEEFKLIKTYIFIVFSLIAVLTFVGVYYYCRRRYFIKKESRGVYASNLTRDENFYYDHKREVIKQIKQNKTQYAYSIISVRNYHFISELFGYDYSETVMKYINDSFMGELSELEIANRISKKEFGILLEYKDELSFRIRLNRLFKKAGNLSTIDSNNLNKVIFTCGVYIIKEGDLFPKIKELAKRASQCSKLEEKNHISFYDNKLEKENPDNSLLEADMMQSLRRGEFKVYLQPKFQAGNESIIGAEALLRWINLNEEVICPGSFLPIFEAYGHMKEIDMYVLRCICKMQQQRIEENKNKIVISMNLSSQTLQDKNILHDMIAVVDEYKLDHSLIEFELSEIVVYENKEHITEIVTRLKDVGFYVTLDNFGSGYSSFDIFKNIPFDVIKLDKDLLKDFNTEAGESEDRLLINHIIGIAKELHTNVLAKGIETEEQRRFAEESKCDMMQGFFYARPMLFEDFNREYTD